MGNEDPPWGIIIVSSFSLKEYSNNVLEKDEYTRGCVAFCEEFFFFLGLVSCVVLYVKNCSSFEVFLALACMHDNSSNKG